MDRADQMKNVPTQNAIIAADIAGFFKGTFKAEVLA